MPVYNLFVEVSQMNPEVKEELRRFGEVVDEYSYIQLYVLKLDIPWTSSQEVRDSYKKSISDLHKKSYVVRITEDSADIRQLSA